MVHFDMRMFFCQDQNSRANRRDKEISCWESIHWIDCRKKGLGEEIGLKGDPQSDKRKSHREGSSVFL